MLAQPPPILPSPPHRWRGLLWLNLLLGGWLWFDFCTDYSLAGAWADLLTPLLAGLVGLGTVLASRPMAPASPRRRLQLAAVPGCLGFGLWLGTGVLVLLSSPAAVLFAATELASEQQVQRVISPDGTQVATVAVRGVGVYSSATLRIFVRVSPRFFPLIERDLTSSAVPGVAGETATYLIWQDNATLRIRDTGEILAVGRIQTEPPAVVTLPIALWQTQQRLQERHVQEQRFTAPLRTLPLYPGPITTEASGADLAVQTGYRGFNIATPDGDRAAAWYKTALSQPPWTVLRTDRREDDVVTATGQRQHRVYNCIDAQRIEATGAARRYYWTLFEWDGVAPVRVWVETPQQGYRNCDP